MKELEAELTQVSKSNIRCCIKHVEEMNLLLFKIKQLEEQIEQLKNENRQD